MTHGRSEFSPRSSRVCPVEAFLVLVDGEATLRQVVGQLRRHGFALGVRRQDRVVSRRRSGHGRHRDTRSRRPRQAVARGHRGRAGYRLAVSNQDPAHDALVGRGQRDNYASATNLARRQALFHFPDPERSAGTPLLERLRWTGTERVLDAGCGNGVWTRMLSESHGVGPVVGLDLSLGMLADTRAALGHSQPLAAGDVGRLPFGAETFDVVLCLWMLYHVGDQQSALEECRRVLRPGGRLLATANVTDPEPPFAEVLGAALGAVTGQSRDRWLPLPSFRAENGEEVLRRVFGRVETHHHVAAFAVPSPEPVLEAMESVRGPVEIFTGLAIDWDEVTGVARSLIEERIVRDGAFRTANASVSFLATP
jgi:SAM-dependent methyltransferase